MIFSWLRNRRRRKLLAEPFPVRWEAVLRRNVWHYSRLSEAERAKLRDIMRVLVAEKGWEGGSGLFVTEEMKVTIAGVAALLLLGRDHDYYARINLIVVYPDKFRSPVREENWDGGWEDDWLSDDELDGQAIHRTAVLLSWADVIAEAPDPDTGDNLVVHEFAHVLDPYENAPGGTPRLENAELETRWRYVMGVAFNDLRAAVRNGEETFFHERATENEAEFFADASEAFYTCPEDMKEQHPDVYEMLAAYYRVDPAKWFAAAEGS
jgi:hypothetical protein